MERVSEVHCYLCGELMGTWEWSAATSPERGRFRPLIEGSSAIAGWLSSLRCVRCGGSVYLEAIFPEKGRDLRETDGPGAPRRRRLPKRQPLAS